MTHVTKKIVMALMLAAVATTASAQIRHVGARGVEVRRVENERTRDRATAALTGVGSVTGWGQARVSDETRTSGLKREVEIHVFGLEPGTAHTVEIDGTLLGTVVTDAFGDGALELESPDDDELPVPAELAPVFGVPLAPVFLSRAHHVFLRC
ncbi:MAG: hypothetical protein ACC742_10800 [Thermoanaerobaculales bacterium]